MKLLIFFLITTLCSAECISHIKQAETEVFEMNVPLGLKQSNNMTKEEKLKKVPFKVYFDTSALEKSIVDQGYSQSSTPICFEKSESGPCNNDQNILTEEKKNYIINKIIPEVKRNMELFFNVHNGTVKDLYDYLTTSEFGGRETKTEINQVLKDPTKKFYKCGEVKVIEPKNYAENIIKDGIGMVMYVTAHPVESQTVLAYAASCVSSTQYESDIVSTHDPKNTGDNKITNALVRRNIMGYTNINPAGLEVDDGKVRINAHTVLHETMHAMGFTDKAIKWGFSKGKNQNFMGKVIRTKRVLDYARKYFGDDSISYVEFEDGGGSGTAGAHWEKRLLYNEIMTGTSSYYSVISNFTLSFFHDLGTFIPNYEYAEKLTWGKGMKKDFFSCGKWPENPPYRGSYGKRGCTGDRGSIGMSDKTSVESLPQQYKNYGDTTDAGMNEIMDYCIHTTLSAGGQCYKKNGVVEAINSFSFVERGSTYGPQSRCLDTSLVMVGIPLDDYGCYNVQCLEKDRGYRIQINNDWYLCTDNAEVSVFGYFGSVKCPPRDEMCPDTLHDETSRTWPDVLKIEPPIAKIGSKITITGKYLNKMNVVYIGGVLQNTTTKVDCPSIVQPGTESKCQIVVDAIKFDDIFFDIITLITEGNVPIDVVVAGASGNSKDRQKNSVYVGFKLEITVEDFFIVFLGFIVNNVFFVAGLVLLLVWIIFLICYLIAKRIIKHKAKRLAREYISY